ncbi:MAG: hypothetical protein DHS20C05_19410 [Hyphococcus sp.]|nr:MAG: hypothetical protein DHS20C05_19410 [Marinicaulis sp.]
MRTFITACLSVFIGALFSLSSAAGQMAFTEKIISVPGGENVEIEIRLPANFDPEKTYPLALGGGYYWKDVDDTRGWILVTLALTTNEVENRYTALLDYLSDQYSIENGRAHMVCYSSCGSAAFIVAGAFPDQFSSVTTLSGHPRNRTEMLAVKDMKIRLIVGENDTYWRKGSEKAYKDFVEIDADVSLEIVPNGNHVITSIAADPFLTRLEALRN